MIRLGSRACIASLLRHRRGERWGCSRWTVHITPSSHTRKHTQYGQTTDSFHELRAHCAYRPEEALVRTTSVRATWSPVKWQFINHSHHACTHGLTLCCWYPARASAVAATVTVLEHLRQVRANELDRLDGTGWSGVRLASCVYDWNVRFRTWFRWRDMSFCIYVSGAAGKHPPGMGPVINRMLHILGISAFVIKRTRTPIAISALFARPLHFT